MVRFLDLLPKKTQEKIKKDETKFEKTFNLPKGTVEQTTRDNPTQVIVNKSKNEPLKKRTDFLKQKYSPNMSSSQRREVDRYNQEIENKIQSAKNYNDEIAQTKAQEERMSISQEELAKAQEQKNINDIIARRQNNQTSKKDLSISAYTPEDRDQFLRNKGGYYKGSFFSALGQAIREAPAKIGERLQYGKTTNTGVLEPFERTENFQKDETFSINPASGTITPETKTGFDVTTFGQKQADIEFERSLERQGNIIKERQTLSKQDEKLQERINKGEITLDEAKNIQSKNYEEADKRLLDVEKEIIKNNPDVIKGGGGRTGKTRRSVELASDIAIGGGLTAINPIAGGTYFLTKAGYKSPEAEGQIIKDGKFDTNKLLKKIEVGSELAFGLGGVYGGVIKSANAVTTSRLAGLKDSFSDVNAKIISRSGDDSLLKANVLKSNKGGTAIQETDLLLNLRQSGKNEFKVLSSQGRDVTKVEDFLKTIRGDPNNIRVVETNFITAGKASSKQRLDKLIIDIGDMPKVDEFVGEGYLRATSQKKGFKGGEIKLKQKAETKELIDYGLIGKKEKPFLNQIQKDAKKQGLFVDELTPTQRKNLNDGLLGSGKKEKPNTRMFELQEFKFGGQSIKTDEGAKFISGNLEKVKYKPEVTSMDIGKDKITADIFFKRSKGLVKINTKGEVIDTVTDSFRINKFKGGGGTKSSKQFLEQLQVQDLSFGGGFGGEVSQKLLKDSSKVLTSQRNTPKSFTSVFAGTGQYELTNGTISPLKLKQKDLVIGKSNIKSSVDSFARTKTRTATRQRSKNVLRESLKFDNILESKQLQKQNLRQNQRLQQRQKLRSLSISNLKINPRINTNFNFKPIGIGGFGFPDTQKGKPKLMTKKPKRKRKDDIAFAQDLTSLAVGLKPIKVKQLTTKTLREASSPLGLRRGIVIESNKGKFKKAKKRKK